MNSFLAVVCVAFLVALVSGDHHTGDVVTLNGPCPTYPAQQNLDSSRLNGAWIGLYQKMNGINRSPPRCVRSNIQVTATGINTTVHMIRANNEVFDRSSVGTPIDGQPGKILFQSHQHPGRSMVATILYTDYDNCVAMVNCQTVGVNHGYSVVILGRQETLAPQLLQNANAAISAANINDQLDPVAQTNCP